MRTKTIVLHNGIVTGATTHKTVVIREITVGDTLDAEEASGSLPQRLGAETLRRRIVSLGDLPGPVPMDIFRKLTAVDAALLSDACDELDAEVVQEALAGRGEAGGGAGSAPPAGQEDPRARPVQ